MSKTVKERQKEIRELSAKRRELRAVTTAGDRVVTRSGDTTRKPTPKRKPAAAKRVTLSDVVTMLAARTSQKHSTVTLTRNAKGDTQFEVVVATGDNATVATVRDAEKTAIEIYERLRKRYPAPVPRVAAPTTGKRSA